MVCRAHRGWRYFVIVGLAVQTPMKSFIGWITILVRNLSVGDRIRIDDATETSST